MLMRTHLSSWRPAQAWAFEQLLSLDLSAPDLRLAFAALASRSLRWAGDAMLHRVSRRALSGARFAKDITTAASMLAAAWR
jgi:hypothetical protein